MRQNLKDKEYFNVLIHEIKGEINEILEDEKRLIEQQVDYNKKGINIELYSSYYIIVKLQYSRGLPLEDISENFNKVIDCFINTFNLNESYSDGGDVDYADVLEIVSLAILIEEKENLDELIIILKKIQYPDYLISFLLKNHSDKRSKDILLWPKYQSYQTLKEITQSSKEKAETLMKEYLEKHYYTKKNLGESYNSHKTEKGYTFSGYWSWEAGAIVKIMGLDDSSFKDNSYYPYDLVNWKY